MSRRPPTGHILMQERSRRPAPSSASSPPAPIPAGRTRSSGACQPHDRRQSTHCRRTADIAELATPDKPDGFLDHRLDQFEREHSVGWASCGGRRKCPVTVSRSPNEGCSFQEDQFCYSILVVE